MPRFIDVLFFFYFLTHIPIALLVDFQVAIPQEYYPQQLIDVRQWYCHKFRDPMMTKPPVWFLSFIGCELLQFPFFFIGTYGFFKGAKKCKWLRLPVIIYGTHVATTLIPILSHILFHDFSNDKLPGPQTLKERLQLLSFYSPYFIFPVALVLDAIFSSAYRAAPQEKKKQK